MLKLSGTLFIAEVLSRFEDIAKFCSLMKEQAGFKALQVKKLEGFFYIMTFEKVTHVHKKNWSSEFASQLKPCLYKRR